MPQHGFSERLPLLQAWAWLEACPEVTGTEAVPLDLALERVLSAALLFPADRPDRDLALADGWAVKAEDTLGASAYNPLFLTLVGKGTAVAAGCAVACHTGETLPAAADAVLPLEAGEAIGAVLEVSAAVARGSSIGRKGEVAREAELAIPAGQRLGARHIALAACLGLTRLTVRRRPAVAVVIAGPKPPAKDALGPAIAALIGRDGGRAQRVDLRGDLPRALGERAPADLVLMIGRSGWGEDDDAARVVSAAGGRIDHHGLALTPGGSAGLGWLGDTPLLLLPGEPLAALANYELLAGRLLRRLSARPADFPGPVHSFALTRKIVSPIGLSEWVPVLCRGSTAEPLALAPADGLVGYAKADGFLIVPAGLEGYAPGTSVAIVVLSGDTNRQGRP